jgi:hypothetical protein
MGFIARGGARSSFTPGYDNKPFQGFVYSFISMLFLLGLQAPRWWTLM